MGKKSKDSFDIKATRVSLVVKIAIIIWSFYLAVQSEELSVAVSYLFVSIVFVGLFIFQLNYYNNKTKGQSR